MSTTDPNEGRFESTPPTIRIPRCRKDGCGRRGVKNGYCPTHYDQDVKTLMKQMAKAWKTGNWDEVRKGRT